MSLEEEEEKDTREDEKKGMKKEMITERKMK